VNRPPLLLIPNRSLVFAIWLAVMLGFPLIGYAATITVNTTDGGIVNINGDCSLAEATVAANFNVAVDDCTSGSAVAEDLIVFEPLFSNGIGAVISLSLPLALGPEDARLFVPSNRFLIIEGAPEEQIFIWTYGGAGTLTIQGVTFRFGSALQSSGTGNGGQIEVRNDSGGGRGELVIQRSTFDRGSGERIGGSIGGELSTFGLDVFIEDSNFVGNSALPPATGDPGGSGGAIGLDFDNGAIASLSITNAVFSNNSAVSSGAISFSGSGGSLIELSVEDSEFSSNTATDDAGFGGAISTSVGSAGSFDVLIRQSTFDGNEAGDAGGAVFLFSGESDSSETPRLNSAVLDNNLFRSNRSGFHPDAFFGLGAMTFVQVFRSQPDDQTEITLTRNSFIENDSKGSGGADISQASKLEAENNLFYRNQSDVLVGGLRYFHPDSLAHTVILIGNSFYENLGAVNPNGAQSAHDLVVSDPSARGSQLDFTMRGNLVAGLAPSGGLNNCSIPTPASSGWNATRSVNTGACAPGTGSVIASDLSLSIGPASDPIHTISLLPDLASVLVDAWPAFICDGIDGTPLSEDLLSIRRNQISGLPLDGDGNGVGECDIGAFERESAISRDLAVTLAGNGSGSVTSSPAGIECPAGNCSAGFADGSSVTLTASADANSTFDGWSGDCTGTGLCQTTMDQARSVTATFTQIVHPLSVQVSGDGQVTSSPAGITCPGDCGEDFAEGTIVTLNQTADPGFAFDGWSGDCTGTGLCQVTMDQARSVTATFTQIVHPLTIQISGSGSVTSSPAGITCPGDCSEDYAEGTAVTLTATPDAGFTFDGWTGDCAGSGSCQVTMDQARSVTATFTQIVHPLTIQISGSGNVTSSPGGIACPGDCSEDYAEGTAVTLAATPDTGFKFDGWTGDCTGTGSCQVRMDQARSVTATFTQIVHPLTVQVSGSGSVTSSPAGINCPGDCSEDYAEGTAVTLSATPDPGFSFDGWSGDCTGTGSCQVTMDQARSVTATFTQIVHPLSVQVSGDGQVTSSPAGITCPGDCGEDFAEGTVVTLNQTADPGFTFDGWSGDCTGTGLCQVTMDQARSVTATFTQIVHPLSVQVSGDGQVTSSPAGITCPGDCGEDFAEGTVVTLNQTADPGFTFDGWSGDCTGTGLCQVTMDQARSVTATFTQIVHPLSVQVSGDGQVTSSPAGITCPGDCGEDFAEGTVVTLNQTADPGFTFDGWSGDCTGTGACQVTMDQGRSVQATFEPATVLYSVDVEIEGNGIGMVESIPAGIDCPADCSEAFEDGQAVTLSAIAGASSEFLGWRADCGFAGTGVCQITVDQPYRAIAIFGDSDLLFLDGFE